MILADKLTTSSQHITSLGFDLTKAKADLKELETRFNQTVRNIQSRSDINVKSRVTRTPIGQLADEMREMSVLESQFRRRMGWFFSGTLFYGALTGAKQAIGAMRDVETAIMKIGRVMEDVTFQTRAYREELLDLASEYGQDFDVAADVALRFAQAGYNVNDSLDLTRTALLAVNSAELNVKNATESMIGIMAQWNLTAADMPLVLDKINKVGDDFTVTSQDLVDGLLRSSQAAQVMGMSLDETIATLTTMREASGRTGREVGNALNSILSYIQRPKAIETLESLGIRMFTDEAKTQFRNFQEIIADIAAKMPEHGDKINKAFVEAAGGIENMNEELKEALGVQEEWTDLQQRDIAQSAAGIYRRNYFIALLQRQARVQDVLNSMIDAEGYSIEENARYMATLEAQVKTFNAEVLKLVTTLGDAGIMDFTKDIVALGTDGVKALDNLIESIGALPPALAAVMGTLSLFSKQMQILKVQGDAFFAGGFISRFSFVGKTGALIDAIKNVNTVLRSQALIAGPQGIYSPSTWQKTTMAVNAFAKTLNIAGAAAKALGVALNMAVNIAAGLAIGLAIQKIYELVNAQKEAAAQANATVQEMRQQQQAIEELQGQYVDLIKSGKDDADSKKELIRIERQLKELLGETGDTIDLQNKSLAENIDLINNATKAKLEEYKATQYLNYENAKRKLAEQGTTIVGATYAGGAVTTPAPLVFSGTLQERFGQVSEALKKYQKILEESNNTNDEARYYLALLNEEYEKMKPEVEKLEKTVENYDNVQEESIKLMEKQADATKNAALAYTALTKEQYKAVDDLGNELDSLASAYQALADGQELSASKMLDLIRNYEEIAVYIANTNDLTLNSGKIAEQVFEIKKRTMIAELELLKQKSEQVVKEYEKEQEAIERLTASYSGMFNAMYMASVVDVLKERTSIEDYQTALGDLETINAQIAAISKISIGSWTSPRSGSTSVSKEKQVEMYLKEQAALDEVNTQLERNARFREIAEGEEWITLSQKRIELHEQEKKAIGHLMEARKKELATLKQGTKEYHELKNTINDLYIDWLDAQNNIIRIEEEMTRRFKDQVKERMDALEKAKDKAIKAIEDEYDAYITAQKRKLALLDEKEQARDRERYLEDYEKRRQELLEKRHYHEIRTGEEHRRAIIDIDKQMAELEVELARQREDWKTEDERDAIRDRIEQLERERDEKIKLAEDALERIQKIIDTSNEENLKKTAAFTKELFNLYEKNFFGPLEDAFRSLDFGDLEDISKGRKSSSGGTKKSSSSGGSSSGEMIGGITREFYEQNKGKGVFTPEEEIYYGNAFGIPSAHTGALTLKEGLVNLAPNELIIDSTLTRALRTFLEPYMGVSTKTDNSRHVQVGNAVNIEHAHFYDEVDTEILGRETARQILIISNSR